MNHQIKKAMLLALLLTPLGTPAADVQISLINDIYDDRVEAEAQLDLLRKEISEIFSYPGAPEAELDGIANVAGKGEGGFTDLFAEYLANRENAEKVADILESDGFFSSQDTLDIVDFVIDIGRDARKLAAAGARLRDIAVGIASRASTGIDVANFIWGEVAEATENRFGDTATRLASYRQTLENGECIIAVVVGRGVTMANKIAIELQSSMQFENQFQLIGVGTVGDQVLGGNFVYDRNDVRGGSDAPSNDSDPRITESTNHTIVLPDGAVVRAPPYPSNHLFNYFDGNQSGVRLRGLIIDAVDRVKEDCLNESELRITEIDSSRAAQMTWNSAPPVPIQIFWDGNITEPLEVDFELKGCLRNGIEQNLNSDCGRSFSLQGSASPIDASPLCPGPWQADASSSGGAIVVDTLKFRFDVVLSDENGLRSQPVPVEIECLGFTAIVDADGALISESPVGSNAEIDSLLGAWSDCRVSNSGNSIRVEFELLNNGEFFHQSSSFSSSDCSDQEFSSRRYEGTYAFGELLLTSSGIAAIEIDYFLDNVVVSVAGVGESERECRDGEYLSILARSGDTLLPGRVSATYDNSDFLQLISGFCSFGPSSSNTRPFRLELRDSGLRL